MPGSTVSRLLKMGAGAVVLAAAMCLAWRIVSVAAPISRPPASGNERREGLRPGSTPDARDGSQAPHRVAIATGEEGRITGSTKSESEEHATVDDLAVALDQFAETFLTDRPDFTRLLDTLDRIGRTATVVTESVESFGSRKTGRIVVPGSAVTGQYEVSFDVCKLKFETEPSKALTPPFHSREINLGFDVYEPGMLPHAMVCFLPDTDGDSREVLKPDEERFIGWEVHFSEQGASLQPVTMCWGPEPGSWKLGNAERFGTVEEAGCLTPTTFETWCRLVRPFMK
jgi:hypothetical protein